MKDRKLPVAAVKIIQAEHLSLLMNGCPLVLRSASWSLRKAVRKFICKEYIRQQHFISHIFFPLTYVGTHAIKMNHMFMHPLKTNEKVENDSYDYLCFISTANHKA